ncbi:hypothetical protein ACTHPF_25795 [Paenibacillus sp. SAF-054]
MSFEARVLKIRSGLVPGGFFYFFLAGGAGEVLVLGNRLWYNKNAVLWTILTYIWILQIQA